MEFPNAGKHCAQDDCNLLDFLPFTCGQCKKVTCLEHKGYTAHNCSESYKLDIKVPVCPVCKSPVPIKRGEDPNIRMTIHIDEGCKAELQTTKKAYTNSCYAKNCKKREAIPIVCSSCRQNYCFSHRLQNSHSCQGKTPNGQVVHTRTGLAAADRARINQSSSGKRSNPSSSTGSSNTNNKVQGKIRSTAQCGIQAQMEFNGNMNEDEALAWALSQSQMA